jgi:hypothetical protein
MTLLAPGRRSLASYGTALPLDNLRLLTATTPKFASVLHDACLPLAWRWPRDPTPIRLGARSWFGRIIRVVFPAWRELPGMKVMETC